MKNWILSIVLFFISVLSFSQIDHSDWDMLLKKHVSKSGKVDYIGFRADKQKLTEYLDLLSANVPAEEASDNAKKAFWCNAYNAVTVKVVIDNYPIRSLNDIKMEGASVATSRFIQMGDEKISFNDIENKQLKAFNKDPRIHFVLNNASFSCPILLNKAFTEENMEEVLTEQTKSFINDDAKNLVSKKSVTISSIFEWYRIDFGDVRSFYNQYAKSIIPSGAKIGYLPYSWELNE